MLILGMLIPRRSPLGPKRALLIVEHIGIISKEAIVIEVTESMVMSIQHQASSQNNQRSLTTLQEKMVMEVEVQVVVVVVPQMTHTEQTPKPNVF